MSDEPLPKVITVAEAAEWLRVSEKVIRRAIASGRLPAVQLGREYRIDPRIIEERLRTGSVFEDEIEEDGEEG